MGLGPVLHSGLGARDLGMILVDALSRLVKLAAHFALSVLRLRVDLGLEAGEAAVDTR